MKESLMNKHNSIFKGIIPITQHRNVELQVKQDSDLV